MTTRPGFTRPVPRTQSGSPAATIAIWVFVMLEAIGIGLVLRAYWGA